MERGINPQERDPKGHYPLSEVRQRIADSDYYINSNASDCARNDFGWDSNDIIDAYKKLKPGHFYKTMPSNIKPGMVLDVYKARINGENIYTHFYIRENHTLVINSFKQDDAWRKG